MSDSKIRAKTVIMRPTASAATNTTSGAVDLTGMLGYSIHAVISGSNVAGTLKLQVSNDGTNFIDLVNSSQSITNSDDYMYNIAAPQYRYVRADWTYSSGTGNLTLTFFFNGVQ